MLQENRLDFSEFNAVAEDFDLRVAAAKKLECAIGLSAGQIAGAIETRAGIGGERIGR